MVGFLTENGTFFERNRWSEDVDEGFLYELEFEAIKAGRCLTFGDDAILATVLQNMEFHTNLVFTITDVHRRFKLAHLRYNTWKSIMEHESVVYDPITYSVSASIWTWIELCESHELASAYQKVAMERMWPELNAIFGPEEARSAELKAMRPCKPPRAFENIGLDGRRMPTIDELIASIVDAEKRSWEREQKKKKKTSSVVQEYDPADVMSTTKGPGRVIAPGTEVLVISPDLNRNRDEAQSSSRNVRAKRFLSFEV